MVVAAITLTSTAATASNDTYFARQWGLTQIGAPAAWTTATGSGVLVGVVDTGIDASHPDLAGKVAGAANCLGGSCRDGDATDDNGHGTEVSGVLAAVTGNSRGMAGVAPDARLLVAKSLDAGGAGKVDDINAGVHWVVDHGAKVVNLSFSDPDFQLTSLLGTPLRAAVEYAWSRGAVPVLASGNYRVGVVDLGSSNYGDLDALVVGATDRTGNVPRYSSAIGNAKWGLVAPGGLGAGGIDDNVITTSRGGRYVAAAGTSLAAPHVAGALAVLISRGFSGPGAAGRLLSTLDRSSCGPGCQGRLDLAAAIAAGPPPAGGGSAPAQAASAGQGRTPPTTAPASSSGPGLTAPPATAPEQALGATTSDGGRPAAVAIAVGLLLAVASAMGAVSFWRLRAGGGW
jgi:subtilisin family serine protease